MNLYLRKTNAASTKRAKTLALALLLFPGISSASLLMKPVQDSDLEYNQIMLTGNYDGSVTTPESILGFPVGQRIAEPDQIEEAVKIWSEQSDRIKVVEYARSHEGRPLFAVFISSPSNLARLDDIEGQINRLADPRNLNEKEAQAIINQLPAVAWMAYSIHGNETSGADAAIAAIYHLAASENPSTTELLDSMVVVIDPLMNPDGRDRFAKSLEQYRGTAPNVDDQSLLHRGDWPSGRTNHYFFDLNRDFFYLTQPETRGRVELINRWRPQLMIDGHEMGPQDTYLMGPPRQPLNDNIAPSLQKWGEVFAEDQAGAFDKKGWRYYTGEWFENWYPGYSNYAEYRGSLHILYEQSRMAEDGVRRPEGTVQTYMESVHHQFVSTMTNLTSLATHSKAMYADYWQSRKQNIASFGKFANRSYVILASDNHGRIEALVDRLLAQNIDVYTATKDIQVKNATNQMGETLNNILVTEGSLVIPNRQPEAPLIAAILEFDSKVKREVLVEERQKNLRDGSSVMYDTTAWNLTMMYGLPAITVPFNMTKDLMPYEAPKKPINSLDSSAIMWSVDGADDRSVAFAARLMEQDVKVRIVDKSAELSNQRLNRGSVVITVTDNPNKPNLINQIKATADELAIEVKSLSDGLGDRDLPDWGGQHFRLLSKPQLAIISHGSFSSYDVGATWWTIDHNLGIRHSQIDQAALTRNDLRRYNTLLMPTNYRQLNTSQLSALKVWIEQGGTLIAHAQSAGSLATKDGLSNVRQIGDIFEKSTDYDISLQREWLSLQDDVEMENVMQHTLNTGVAYPWDDTPKPLSEVQLKKRDQWQKRFMPSGAIVAGRTDQQHWLTFGVEETLPLLYGDQPVLMSDDKSEAVVRIGVISPDDSFQAEHASSAFGWSTIPTGHKLTVRMSGLLWPEAAQRVANSAYLTRERLGRGQIILFSGEPNFRGSARGSNRLLLNAIVYGAGLGTSAKVEL